MTRLFHYTLPSVAVVLVGCSFITEKNYTFAPPAGAPEEPKISSVSPKELAPVMPPPVTNHKPLKVIVSPANSLVGRVVMADPNGRFVVLNFPIGHMPTLNQPLSVFRHGVKAGEVKVTGPQRDDNIAADTLSGEPQAGDEVRNQ